MSVAELLPTLTELDRVDKLRVMQFLENELSSVEEALIVPSGEYPIWSSYGSYGAAQKLLDALDAEAIRDEKARTEETLAGDCR